MVVIYYPHMTPIVLFFQSTVSKSWRDKLRGVYHYASKAGWQVQVIDSKDTPVEIRSSIGLWNPIGCLVDRALSTAKAPFGVFKDIPTVFLDQSPQTICPKNCSFVTNDSARCAELAAEELLKDDIGHFAYIPWTRPFFWDIERERGFSASVRKAGRQYHRINHGADLENILRSLPKPCGILCANDITAQRTMATANRIGIRIPQDLTVIGIDNDELICENTRPTLTSVLPDFEGAGRLIAEQLDRLLHGEDPKQLVYHPIGIIRRESSRRLPTCDTRTAKAIAYIRRHCLEPSLSTDEVVAAAACSRRLLDLRFRQITGHSIRDEIHTLRLEKAITLLRNPNQAIGPIASLCGYTSEPFFKRLFKKRFGMSMREWRMRNAISRS